MVQPLNTMRDILNQAPDARRALAYNGLHVDSYDLSLTLAEFCEDNGCDVNEVIADLSRSADLGESSDRLEHEDDEGIWDDTHFWDDAEAG